MELLDIIKFYGFTDSCIVMCKISYLVIAQGCTEHTKCSYLFIFNVFNGKQATRNEISSQKSTASLI